MRKEYPKVRNSVIVYELTTEWMIVISSPRVSWNLSGLCAQIDDLRSDVHQLLK